MIGRRAIFHYTYVVPHHPDYRAKFEVNLKRDFSRLPFYEDFRQRAAFAGARTFAREFAVS